VFEGQTLYNLPVGQHSYVYRNVKGVSGCDSTLVLTVLPNDIIAVEAPEYLCADESSCPFLLTSGKFENVRVLFNAHTLAAGFKDTVVLVDDNEFKFDIPLNARAGHYGGKFVFKNWCSDSELNFAFTLRYPASIITQRWNDVIAVKNSDFNGEYNFSSFQWYKNDIEIPGATKSYYNTENEKLDFSADYSVALTRMDDETSMLSCAYRPVMIDETNILVYPSAVAPKSNINISTDRNMPAVIYNSMGILVARYELTLGDNIILSPSQRGIYLLQLILENGENQTYRISVK
jgi:hypothetical protein